MMYVALMFCTGLLLGLQPPINAALGRHIGMLEGAVVNFIVGLLILASAACILGKGSLFKAVEAPWWQLTGGCFGALMVFAGMISVPRVGALTTMLAMILGNLIMGALIDNFGWIGVPVNPFTLRRLLGLCLVFAGLYFIVKR